MLREISDNGYRVLSFVLCTVCTSLFGNFGKLKGLQPPFDAVVLTSTYRSLSKHRYPSFLELAPLDLILFGGRISNDKVSKFCKIKFTQIYVGCLRFLRPKFVGIFYVFKYENILFV